MKRIDVISDTHGRLSPELLAAIGGADLLVHAGDFTSEEDHAMLAAMCPMYGVLGNNDFYYDYGPDVQLLCRFEYEGLRFAVSHYYADLPREGVDIAVCGHTHRPKIEQEPGRVVVNPGSASYPRDGRGPSIARLVVEDGRLMDAQILRI